MKNALLVLMVCLFSNALLAQTAKVIFYRNDPFHKLGIFQNGKRIHKIKKHEVYTYSANNENGTYFMKPTKKRTINLSPEPNTITFVEVGFKSEIVYRKSSIKKRTLAEFRKDYASKKWLRKSMAKAGYKSVDDLIGHEKVALN
jgi:hypothetical protein